jgi:hypothetical protein
MGPPTEGASRARPAGAEQHSQAGETVSAGVHAIGDEGGASDPITAWCPRGGQWLALRESVPFPEAAPRVVAGCLRVAISRVTCEVATVLAMNEVIVIDSAHGGPG